MVELKMNENGGVMKNDIGMKMKEVRKDLNMSVDDLAERTGISRSTLYRYENGEIKDMSISKIIKISKALKTTPNFLLNFVFER